jgi:2-hydroxychromene-2-carboxylate isomerase
MSADIEFYFDFSSPYGYLASFLIDDLAARHGRGVDWRPMMLGIAMKQTGSQPLVAIPIKGDYSRHDLERTARRLNIPFVIPEPFPIMALAAARAFYWISDDDPVRARTFAKAAFQTYFGEGRDISTPATVAEVAAEFGVDRDALLSALKETALKDRLKTETNAAVERGVFGSPFIFVDGEPFWGADRLRDVERWLDTGGW